MKLLALLLSVTLSTAQDGAYLEALLLLAEAATSAEEIEDALVQLEEPSTREQYQDWARYHEAIGRLHFKNEDFDLAEQAIEVALEKELESVTAHTLLGEIRLRRGNAEGAEVAFREATRLSPTLSNPMVRLIDFYVENKRFAEAKQLLEAMTAEDPRTIAAWRRLANIAYLEKEYETAREALIQVRSRIPNDQDALFQLGQVYLAQNRLEAATELFETFVKSNASRYVSPKRVMISVRSNSLSAWSQVCS